MGSLVPMQEEFDQGNGAGSGIYPTQYRCLIFPNTF